MRVYRSRAKSVRVGIRGREEVAWCEEASVAGAVALGGRLLDMDGSGASV